MKEMEVTLQDNSRAGRPSSAEQGPRAAQPHTPCRPSLSPFQPHQRQRGSHFGPLSSIHFLLHLQNVLQGPELGRVGVVHSLDFLKWSTWGFLLGKAVLTDGRPTCSLGEHPFPSHQHQARQHGW